MNAREIFPNVKEGTYSPFGYDYGEIMVHFGEVVFEVMDDDYEGDTRFFIKNEDKYGWVVIGFGSCSGCDWLQGCSTYDEIQELIDSIENDIEWHDSLSSLKDRFRSKDWELEYYGRREETKEFIEKVLSYEN